MNLETKPSVSTPQPTTCGRRKPRHQTARLGREEIVNRRRTTRAFARIRLVAGVAAIMFLCNANGWAETTTKHKKRVVTTTTTTVVSTSEQQRLDALTGQVNNLQKQETDTTSEVKKNLSDNLGISVHALVDTSYEHNFNQPVNNINNIRVFDQDGFQLTQGN